MPKGFGGFFKRRPKQDGSGAQAAEGSAPGKEGGAEGSAAATGKASGGSAGAGSSGAKGAAPSESRGGEGQQASSRASGGGGSGKGGSSRNAAEEEGGGGGDGGHMNSSTIALTALTSAVLAMQLYPRGADPSEITFAEFRRELLESGAVQRIVIVNKNKARVHMRAGGGGEQTGQGHYWFSLGSINGFEKKLEQAQADLGVAPRDYLPVTYESETSMGSEVLKIAPTLLLIGFWAYMMRGGIGGMGGAGGGGGRNIFQVGKSKPTIISKEKKTGVTFADVAGLAEAKVEVMELVDFLKNPERYQKLGAKIPKGALLTGPPGTGKTLLAKATAGEANVPFLSVSGSDFIEMFVGVGPARVRDLFAQAKSMQPCIVWIDEIDAIGKARGKGGMAGGNDERENTLNQLLVEMDGFSTTGNIVIMAGTNRPDTLDSALLRPGRFDRSIDIGAPDIKGRAEIFRVHLPKIRLADDMELVAQKLASLSPGAPPPTTTSIHAPAPKPAQQHKLNHHHHTHTSSFDVQPPISAALPRSPHLVSTLLPLRHPPKDPQTPQLAVGSCYDGHHAPPPALGAHLRQGFLAPRLPTS